MLFEIISVIVIILLKATLVWYSTGAHDGVYVSSTGSEPCLTHANSSSKKDVQQLSLFMLV